MTLKLNPQLFDLFQHCEIKCSSACCGWDAFDFSPRWVSRWCDWRDAQTVRLAAFEIDRIRRETLVNQQTSNVVIDGFFAPSADTLIQQLEVLSNAMPQQS